MYEKLKSWLADDALFMALLLILVGVVSFGLGRASVGATALGTGGGPPQIVFNGATTASTTSVKVGSATVDSASPRVVASESGAKYHLPDCPSAGQIKASNLIEFASPALAAAAGYAPAANCPGLQ